MYSESGPNQSIKERLVDERAMIGRMPGYVKMGGIKHDVHYDVPPVLRFFGKTRTQPTIDQILMVGVSGGYDDLVGWEGSHRNSWSMGQY